MCRSQIGTDIEQFKGGKLTHYRSPSHQSPSIGVAVIPATDDACVVGDSPLQFTPHRGRTVD